MRLRLANTICLVLLMATACTGAPSRESAHGAPPAPINKAQSCDGAIEMSPLPTWARAGFTPPDGPVAHVMGLGGEIVGVVFGYPFHAPPLAGRGNKILWVARTSEASGNALKIHATLNGSRLAVDREVAGGPGPSIIDMPRAGCWTFKLSWSGHQDGLAIPYTGS